MVKVRTVLISVSDKTGVVELASRLVAEHGVTVLSTGGTASALRDAGVPVTDVSEVTGFPEILDGRVKTIHPHIAAGILADRRKEAHLNALREHEILPIELVVVNLYPFKETIAKPGVTFEEEIENIDIGGPTMIRAASKNFENVAVVVSPARYDSLLEEMASHEGQISRETRFELMVEAFGHTADYDEAIYEHFNARSENRQEYPGLIKLVYRKKQDLRYGENPHQTAAFYEEEDLARPALASSRQLHGKELSYNNILDLDAAWTLCCEFGDPAVVIVKHNNPCGAAIANELEIAYEKAHAADPVSAFGGIIAVNRPLDAITAEKMSTIFYEAIIAPGFEDGALEILTNKKDLRLIDMQGSTSVDATRPEIRKVDGGMLVQTADRVHDDIAGFRAVSEQPVDKTVEKDLLFAWTVAKHVKSNAIVFVKDGVTTGIGAGQMSRVDSVDLAVRKGHNFGHPVEGSVMASDAFFPFRDGIDQAARAGIKAVISPGGSIRDDEVIQAANEHKMGMIFTGIRHFKH